VIENTVTHCYYWRAVNALSDDPSYAGVYRAATQLARYPAHCRRHQSTVQLVYTHREYLRMQFQPAATANARPFTDRRMIARA